MRLAVFGATGKTGQHIVQQALEAGHDVTALVRTPSKLTLQHNNLSVVQGDILDIDRVEKALQGADAVISVLGPINNKPEFNISRGMENILKAMQKQNIQRVIISAGAGIREPEDKLKLIDRFFGLLLRVLSKNAVADMEHTVQKVKASNLNWTVVRVPMLTDEPAKEKLKVGYLGDISYRITRADMASFMLKQTDDTQYLHRAPAISN